MASDSPTTPTSWWVNAPRLSFSQLAESEVSKHAMLPEVEDYLYKNEERVIREQSETYAQDGDSE